MITKMSVHCNHTIRYRNEWKTCPLKKQMSSVVYLGHLPHGFYEDQIRGYFTQFGEIKNLRISRNKKTGQSKHYAFVEFLSPEVAQIVSEAMDNYLLFNRLLQCKVMKKEDIHPEIWKGANRKFQPVAMQARPGVLKFNREKTDEEKTAHRQKASDRLQEKLKKLKALKIDYKLK